MALISPGIEVKVIDESQYASTAVGTVPMLVIATGQDKSDPTTGGTASGTLAANAEKTYLIGSQRELVSTFGEPAFYQNTSGTALHGYELNEYGLMAAYSLLGVSNRAFIVRADIDTTELTGSAGRPSGAPANGTHWVNSGTTSWGVFQWNHYTQKFASMAVKVITDSNDIDTVTGRPKASIGKAGDYAIDATNTNNLLYAKFSTVGWIAVGSSAWYAGLPTLTGTNTTGTVSLGDIVTINGVAVSMTGTTFAQAAQDINDAAIPGVTSNVGPSGALQLFGDSTVVGGAITVSATGTFLTDAGWVAQTYYVPAIQISAHTSVPEWRSGDADPRPLGSVWIKTTSSNNGASIDVSSYSSILENFVALNANVFKNEAEAIFAIDPIGGGLNIEEDTVMVLAEQTSAGEIAYKLMQRAKKGETSITGASTTPTFTGGNQFTIESSGKNTNVIASNTITLSGTTAADFVADVLAALIPHVTAQVEATGAITIKHELGGFIKLTDVTGSPIADAGITLATAGVREDIGTGEPVASNFTTLTYAIGATQPTSNPTNGRMWYQNVTDEIDIMIHDGTTWRGYQNVSVDARGFDLTDTNPAGPFVSASAPLEQSDNTPLVYGDLWIDTSDLENFPVIKRFDLVDGEDTWVTIDNTDQTSSDGILFADARYMGDGSSDVANDDVTDIADLLTSDYVDLDAPSDALYPRGTLLFNTRRSSYNVKQFRLNYFNATDFPGQVLPAETDAWVSIAGNKTDGSPYMGRKAVRQVIVEKMKSVIDTSGELREEQRNFNVMAAPGYPELLQNMIALNNDRRNTGFIVGDTPFRLAANSTDLQNWANNVGLATDNGDDGLVSADTYMGVFYPHGITTDLDGNSIMVPASHMILRTMIRSDEASYPWFAPAGTRRGIVDNATGLGYLDTRTGEFISTGVRESLRDTLYENSINPVAFFPGNGILNYGNKTRTATASALDRINVARLVAYIRERLAVITKPFVFEPNDKLTRDEVKQVVEQLMNDLVAKRGLYDYLVVCDETNNTPDRIDRNELYIDIAIEPVKAVEYIYIPVRIQNTGSI
jgi:hypothetical protein